jgi:ATP-binding cassette, subfamily F, member 3
VSLAVLEGVGLAFGEQIIVEELDLRIADADRIGLCGPNGSGKTTLLRVLAGEQAVDQGRVRTRKGVRVGYLPQDINVAGGRSLGEFVLESVPGRTALDAELAAAEAELAAVSRDAGEETMIDLAARIAHVHQRIDHFEQFFAEHEALRILAGLGFAPGDRHRDLGEFSGGWKMRAVLASLLFQQPDLLLMDEPTNHLDMPSVVWLSGFLRRFRRAFVLISHDREFLDEQVERIVSFEPEGVRQYRGDYGQYRRQRAEEEVVLENQAKNVTRERERLRRFVERFRATASKARQARSRAKQIEKMKLPAPIATRRAVRIKFPPTARSAGQVVRVEKLRKSFGDLVVFPGIDLVVRRGEKIGIVGPNGAGKTTLLKIIAGELLPTGGAVHVGSDVRIGYYAQHHADTFHADRTVYEEVAGAHPRVSQTRVRSVLGAFLFHGDDVDKPIKVLSGGERARVALARLLIDPGNLLLMDEPTNHLDLESSEALAESLRDYDGTILFVSHNRSLVRALATRIWSLEAGAVETYPGTLEEYMDSCRRRFGGADVEPPRVQRSERPIRAHHNREDERAERRREAAKKKRVEPIRQRVDELEARIARLEAEQSDRGAQLADPEVFSDAARRNRLLGDYAAAAEKIEELTARWEAAVSELDAADGGPPDG